MKPLTTNFAYDVLAAQICYLGMTYISKFIPDRYLAPRLTYWRTILVFGQCWPSEQPGVII